MRRVQKRRVVHKEMREIVLDTETTGLEAQGGDRIVEIGCIELINHMPTDNEFHVYINPERDMPKAAFEVHGLSQDFLAGQAVFGEICEDFLAFIGEAPLVIHNARFDMGFLNAELEKLSLSTLSFDRAIDTLAIARKKFPGSPNSLDALCRRFEIDTAVREKHGAMIDAMLLARVYLELIGGQQPGLHFMGEDGAKDAPARQMALANYGRRPRVLESLLTDAERADHRRFVHEALGKDALWLRSKP